MAPLRPVPRTTTILSGATASAAVQLEEASICGIRTPAALTGVALTFTCSDTAGGTFDPVMTAAGAAYTLTVAASRYTVADPLVFLGVKWVKVVSGSAEGADRIITLYVRNVNS